MATFLIIIWTINIGCAVVCYQKDKIGFMIAGLLICAPLLWIGAIRLARPDSKWYKRYSHNKLKRAWERFENTPYVA